MKTDLIIQELLLVTTTTFCNRQLCETDAKDKHKKQTPAEQMEAACWNGLLDEMLPEMMPPSSKGKKLFLWQVETKEFCLMISKAEYPPVQEMCSTLDPHVFLYHKEMN